MTTTVNLKKILHRPQWEQCNILPFSTSAGCFTRNLQLSSYNINYTMMVSTAALMYQYDTITDSTQLLPAPANAFSGTFGAGACGKIHPVSRPYPATSGTTSTITTGLTIVRDIRGYKIRITQGAQAGQELTILSNTIGANSVITVATQSLAFSSSTLFQLLTPHVYMYNAGATGPNIFQVYSWALNTWTVLNNLNITIGTDCVLVATPSIVGGAFDLSGSGYTFGSSTSSSINICGANWSPNQWINSQIRITSGTGPQTRTIVSNTSNTVGISGTWQANPDATSSWRIEGNDDYLYLLGNASVNVYRYSIQYNFWTTLTITGTIRTNAPGAGLSGNWPYGVQDSAWTTPSTIKNGRYIYSFRGAGTNELDIYDIAASSWTNIVQYGNAAELFNTGSAYEYDGGNYIYTAAAPLAPGVRIQRYNLITTALDPTAVLAYPQGASVVGDKLFTVPYTDGTTNLVFLYNLVNTSNVMFRTLISPFVP